MGKVKTSASGLQSRQEQVLTAVLSIACAPMLRRLIATGLPLFLCRPATTVLSIEKTCQAFPILKSLVPQIPEASSSDVVLELVVINGALRLRKFPAEPRLVPVTDILHVSRINVVPFRKTLR